MAKPLGIVLGIHGGKAPLPPEAVIAHAKPLQVEITEAPEPAPVAQPSKTKNKKAAAPAPVEEVDAAAAPVIELTLPDGENG